WRDRACQVSAGSKVLKQRLWDWEKALDQVWKDKQNIHEARVRQYQEPQKQTASWSRSLETEVKSLQEQLAASLQEKPQVQKTAAWVLTEKDETIAQLQDRLSMMEMEYEKILHMSEDEAAPKLAGARQHWEEMGTTISREHKEHLKEFGLNPLKL
ncbi:CC153 protein, partial [Nothocercus julius]|nr:CC153 protein [Nothocercus julius]